MEEVLRESCAAMTSYGACSFEKSLRGEEESPAHSVEPRKNTPEPFHSLEFDVYEVHGQGSSATGPEPPAMTSTRRADKFRLSSSQQRLWFLAQMEGGSEAYNVPIGLRLKGHLNRTALRRTLDRILIRHEALRTTFTVDNGEPVQRVTPVEDSRFLLVEHDLRERRDAKAETERLADFEAHQSFHFETGPVIRGRLIQLSENEHVLLLTMHHIASDGWSMDILANELNALYGAFVRGEKDPLPELKFQYPDYSVWQQRWIESDDQKEQADYWKKALAGAPALLELPTDRPRPLEFDYAGAFERFELDEEQTDQLKAFSRRHRVTPFMTLLSAWAVLMTRLSGQTDVLIGVPAANRSRKDIENLIGYFANTLVIRLDLSGSPRVSELLLQARKKSLTAQQYQEIPFEQVVELARPARTMAHSPLFQVMFAWQGTAETRYQLPGLEVESLSTPHRASKFDLSLKLRESGKSISGGLEYSTSLFKQATIERYLGYFKNILRSMIADDTQAIDRLSILPETERDHLLREFNRTLAEYPKEVPLAQLVEQQVERTPDAVAVVYDKQRLTFRDLNARANQLARELINQGAGPDQIVGLYVTRSTDLIVALLAIVKAGAAYLPLDPMFPPERLGYMLSDSGSRLLITEESLRKTLPAFAGTIIELEENGWQANSRDNPAIAVRPEDLAYVIYTSGSTGKPKGVQIPRGALTNFLWSMRESLRLSDRDRLLAVTTISFDIAGLEIWLPLLTGAQTVMASFKATADGNALKELLERHDITFLQATPVTWRLLFDTGWRGKNNLQAVCGGEAMPQEVAVQLVPVVKLVWNLYGPTETTIWSTGYQVTDGRETILIGRPIFNTQCYILDAHGEPVPVGVTGELFIAGDGLARGYLNRPELTAEKFVADPFAGGGARMYRTGDLARYRPDGNIECQGRIDHQVKLRGYRIELGEIEARLAEFPGVREAVVIAREDTPGDKRLVAYYAVSTLAETEKSNIGAEQFRAYLSKTMPEYMVPAAYVRMEALPLTPNGKIDRKALPAPDRSAPSIENYEPPQGELEIILAGIWADVLKVDNVGRHDNFFDCGGNSLLAVKLISRAQEIVRGEAVPLSVLLEAPTIARLATWVESHEGDQQQILVQMQPGSPACIPFFCVCAAASTALVMRPLAKVLDKDVPFYSIQNKGLDGSEPCASLKEAARLYLDEIRKVQPEGPYCLGGYCFGGYVAFEMACMLEEAGERVSALFLVDSTNPAQLRFLSTEESLSLFLHHCYRRTIFHARRIRHMQMAAMFSYAWGRLKAMYFHGERIVGKGPQKEPLKELPEELKSSPASAGRTIQVIESMERWGRDVTNEFIPQPVGGDVVVFWAKERYADPFFDQFLGWKPVVRGSIQSIGIEAHHGSIGIEPAVRIIAETINARVRKSSPSKNQESAAAFLVD